MFMGYSTATIAIINEFLKGKPYEITSTGSVMIQDKKTGLFTSMYKREQVEDIIKAYTDMQEKDLDLVGVLRFSGVKVNA